MDGIADNEHVHCWLNIEFYIANNLKRVSRDYLLRYYHIVGIHSEANAMCGNMREQGNLDPIPIIYCNCTVGTSIQSAHERISGYIL